MPMILGWYVFGQLVAWCALPLTWSVFRKLEDRGYAARHAVGLLVTGFLLWTGTAARLVTNDRQGAFVALGAVLVLGVLAGRCGHVAGGTQWRQLREWCLRRWRLIALHEAAFLLAFLGWCWVRQHDPAIDHTEQPMDLMLLAGILADRSFPIQDPWLSGFAVSYYYLGYWLQATLAHLAGSVPEVAYNLAQAWWFAMVCSGAFGVVFNLLAAHSGPMEEPGPDSREPARFARAAVLGGLLGAFFVAGAANLDATARALRWLAGWLEDPGGWWWFRSTRVMADAGPGAAAIELITEFPAFSFVLGDNHPHLLSLPFVLLTVMVALNLQLAGLAAAVAASAPAAARVRFGISALRQVTPSLRAGLAASTSARPWTAALMVALVAGAPLAINTWDLPLLWLVLAIPAWTLGRRAFSGASGGGLAGVLAAWTALVFATVALFFPYLLTAQSQARGWLPNLFQPSHPWQFLLVFGAFVPVIAALLLAPGERTAHGRTLVLRATGSMVAIGGAILLAGALWTSGTARGQEWAQPYVEGQGLLELAGDRWLARPFVLLGLALGAGLAWRRMASLRAGAASDRPDSSAHADRFAVLLVTLALAAALLPELLFVHDVFATRLNSIFKFYYQAWVMAALASAYAVVRYWASSGARRWLVRCSLALLAASAVYPLAAIGAKRAQAPGPASLDGLAHLSADERAAFDWIRRWTRSDDIVLQAVGESYRAEHGRASAATGRATLLGWQGHEMQWRGASFGALSAGRQAAAETIYRTGGAGDIEGAAARFSIDYIYLGPIERELYAIDQDRERMLSALAQPVFASGEFRILRYSRGSSPEP